jgi:large subunit ribosomal protein L35
MPKQKTHKGLSKRVKITASGKVKRHKSNGGHLLSNKTGKQSRSIRQATTVVGKNADTIKSLLGK